MHVNYQLFSSHITVFQIIFYFVVLICLLFMGYNTTPMNSRRRIPMFVLLFSVVQLVVFLFFIFSRFFFFYILKLVLCLILPRAPPGAARRTQAPHRRPHGRPRNAQRISHEPPLTPTRSHGTLGSILPDNKETLQTARLLTFDHSTRWSSSSFPLLSFFPFISICVPDGRTSSKFL